MHKRATKVMCTGKLTRLVVLSNPSNRSRCVCECVTPVIKVYNKKVPLALTARTPARLISISCWFTHSYQVELDRTRSETGLHEWHDERSA